MPDPGRSAAESPADSWPTPGRIQVRPLPRNNGCLGPRLTARLVTLSAIGNKGGAFLKSRTYEAALKRGSGKVSANRDWRPALRAARGPPGSVKLLIPKGTPTPGITLVPTRTCPRRSPARSQLQDINHSISKTYSGFLRGGLPRGRPPIAENHASNFFSGFSGRLLDPELIAARRLWWR